MTTQVESRQIPSGPAAAALLTSAIGCVVIGLLTTGAVISEGLRNILNWYNAAGPLTGKAGVGVVVWLISWVVLHNRWKDQDVNLGRIFTWALVILAIGLLLTFPPIFEAFE